MQHPLQRKLIFLSFRIEYTKGEINRRCVETENRNVKITAKSHNNKKLSI